MRHRELLSTGLIYHDAVEHADRHTHVNLTLTSSVTAAMPCLPANLQKLSEQFLLALHGESIGTLHTSMARFANLRVLCIADFLTETIVIFLSGMVFPNLHTLGFCLDSQANTGYFSLDGASGNLKPTFESKSLMTVFPNLEQMKVSCVGGGHMVPSLMRVQVRVIKFACAWIDWTFPKLKGIICNSAHVNVEFVDLSRRIYVTYKI